MKPEEIENLFHEKIPITIALGLRVASWDGHELVLEAPLTPNRNHLGTAFGGSLNAIAVSACYGILWAMMQERGLSGNIVLKESRIRYLHPVTEQIRAVCQLSMENLDVFEKNLRRNGKARIELRSTISENNCIAVCFDGEFVAFATP